MMKKTAVITGADGGMGSEITKAVISRWFRQTCLQWNRWLRPQERLREKLLLWNF